jgi:hypothetical protein
VSRLHPLAYWIIRPLTGITYEAVMLWETSIYKFRVPKDFDKEDDEDLLEIPFDVTLSAPTDKTPGGTLESVFTQVFDYLEGKKVSKILDFGAAKLRNTLYLLEEQYIVCAVEFEKTEHESVFSREMYKLARDYGPGKFCELIYPRNFIKAKKQRDFDMVILINVLSTMPIPAERLLVLRHCQEKLRKGGYLFYFQIHGHSFYRAKCTNDVRIGDGYYMNQGYYKSFYRDFNPTDVDFMLMSSGFDYVERFVVKNNLARLYCKKGPVLLDGLISVPDVEKICELGKTIEDPQAVEPKLVKRDDLTQPIIPNPDEFNLDALWIKKLKQLPLGHEGATEFHHLANLILRRVFEPELKDFRIEREINEGRKRVDIVASNPSDKGFFAHLKKDYDIRCPLIFMECKNYEAMKNEELDQLMGRFTPQYGQFGLLIYRGKKNSRELLNRCRDALKGGKNNYILPINDNDLIWLLKMRREESADEEIFTFLNNRFQELIL